MIEFYETLHCGLLAFVLLVEQNGGDVAKTTCELLKDPVYSCGGMQPGEGK